MGEERDDRLAWREAWGVTRSSLSQGLPLTALSRALRGLSSDWDFDEAQALATYCLGGAASLEGLPDLADWASDEEALVALRDVFLWWGAEEDEEAPCPEAEGLLMDAEGCPGPGARTRAEAAPEPPPLTQRRLCPAPHGRELDGSDPRADGPF